MRPWGLADYEVNEIIEVFAEREDAEQMLRDCLSDEPEWVEILEVVPVEFVITELAARRTDSCSPRPHEGYESLRSPERAMSPRSPQC
jgi:hypothetical protein